MAFFITAALYLLSFHISSDALILPSRSFKRQIFSQLSSKRDPDSTRTPDDDLSRSLRARLDEINLIKDENIQMGETADQARRDIGRSEITGSVNLLAILVSLSFVATVAVSGDSLFTKPDSPIRSAVPKIINADKLLQVEFESDRSSVLFREVQPLLFEDLSQ
jgi:hypothetical protein